MTMPTITHIENEELMAFADGELPGDEARQIEAHLLTCTTCAARLASWRDEAASLEETLGSWAVPEAPERVERVVLGALAARGGHGGPAAAPESSGKPGRWFWWVAGAGVAAAVLVTATVSEQHRRQQLTMHSFMAQETLSTLGSTSDVPPPPPPPSPAMKAKQPGGVAGMAPPALAMDGLMQAPSEFKQKSAAKIPAAPMADKRAVAMGGAGGRGPLASASSAPMIARTATLSMIVDDVDRARVTLEGLLGRYGGYAAQMQVSTPGAGIRNLTASLRVPATELPQVLADLKTLGHVESEQQTGEDVGQDHADLEARLNTARITEERLRGILRDHTGSVSDVLEVEEQIATTRENIESLEAELDGMEHRVRYATVDLTLSNRPAPEAPRTVAARLGDAIAAGWRNLGELVLGLVLWLAEDGPSIAVVLLIIGVPGVWLWRRYRRVRGQW